MENKLNIESVHTVQIDGKDVEVVIKQDVDKAVEDYTQTLTSTLEKKAQDSIKRDYSKKLGINLFDDKEIEKYLNNEGDKVARSEYDKLNEEIEAYKPIKENYSKLEQNYKSLQFENAVITNNVDEKHKDKVIKLANLEMSNNNEMTPQQAVEKIVSEFDMFKSRTPRVGRGFGEGPEGKTDSEKYINEKYKDNPYYKK